MNSVSLSLSFSLQSTSNSRGSFFRPISEHASTSEGAGSLNELKRTFRERKSEKWKINKTEL